MTPYNALMDDMKDLGQALLAWRSDAHAREVLSQADLKLRADLQAHERLSDAIGTRWPDIPIISEEDKVHDTTRPDRYWLIDPIDGTASWLGGFDGFVTQAALIEAGQPVAGIVYAPAQDRMYSGFDGQDDRPEAGAWLNGQRVAASSDTQRLVMIDNTPEPHGIAATLMSGMTGTGYVESGSLGLKCCRVWAGDADLFVKDVVVRDWDLAPAAAFAQHVGGALMQLDGSPYVFDGAWEKTTGFIAARDQILAAKTVAFLASTHSQGAGA